MTDTIFYKIIQGDAPCYKVYEDDDFLVMLDIFPAHLGHCVIMPKIPARDIFDLNEKSAARLWDVTKHIANMVKTATGCDGINILQNSGAAAGQTVFYFHVHVIPRFSGMDDGLDFKGAAKQYEKQDFEMMLNKLVSL
ncbi:MAG: HIT family protein [Defluviitaleaceae bacterium]|nr:HIT family protein [Defluviitaleaceae bacterium]